MADFLDDGEFWLPPRFLTEDDPFIDNRSFSPKATADLFSSVYGLDLGSPVESLFGSTENESDEEDMLADLSRNMARTTLDDGDFKNSGAGFGCDKFEARILSGSPQSTLRPTNFDMICQAVGEVANRRLNAELYGRNGTGSVFAKQKQHSPVSVPVKAFNSDASRHTQTSILYHQILEFQILQLKKQRQKMMQQQRQKMMQQQQQQRSDSGYWGPSPTAPHDCGRTTSRPLVQSPAAWPLLQQAARHQHNEGSSGMTALFVPSKKECAGTGVFLPRRAGPQPDPRKKIACSTALIPAKGDYALKLENVGPHQPHLPYRFNGGDGSFNVRRSGAGALQNGSVRSQLTATSPEIRLPQEWTY